MELTEIAALAQPSDRRVLLLVLDGLGGLPREPGGQTELEAARTPNLDELARSGSCGLHEPVAPGITPGSGPGHLALFGFDPLRYQAGRGVLAALGTGFDLESRDIAARGNFCTLGADGSVVDRRAGRISSEEASPLVETLDAIEINGAEVFVRPVKEHRFLLVLRPDAPTSFDVEDTDPGREGDPPGDPAPRTAEAEGAADLARRWLVAASETLAGRAAANMVLLRGFSGLPDWPSFQDVFGMRALAVAAYPMYRGAARLLGMEAVEVEDGLEPLADRLERGIADFDFFFLHYKATDKAGEDGDFDRKVSCIEAADEIVPRLLAAGAEITLVTGDHSTPATMASHSWHPVPFLLHGGEARADEARSFGETECARGSLGLRRGRDLLPLAAARAGRLAKFGA